MEGRCRVCSRSKDLCRRGQGSTTSPRLLRPSRSWTRITLCTGIWSQITYSSTMAFLKLQISGSASLCRTRATPPRPCSDPRSIWPHKFSKAKPTPSRLTYGRWVLSFSACSMATVHSNPTTSVSWSWRLTQKRSRYQLNPTSHTKLFTYSRKCSLKTLFRGLTGHRSSPVSSETAKL